MRVRVEALKPICELISRLMPSHHPIPAWEHMEMGSMGGPLSDQDAIVLTGSTPDAGFRLVVPAEGRLDPSVGIHAHSLVGAITKLPDSEVVEITEEGGKVLIKWAHGEYRLHRFPTSELLNPPDPQDGDVVARIGIEDWREILTALQTAQRFAAKDDPRQYLMGVLLEIDPEENGAWIVGSDSQKLYAKWVQCSVDKPVALVIPRHAIKPLLYTAGQYVELRTKDDETMWVLWGDNYISIHLLSGPYAPWRDVIPSETPSATFTVSLMELRGALKRLKNFATTPYTPLRASIEESQLVLEVEGERGKGKEVLGLPFVSGEAEFAMDFTTLEALLSPFTDIKVEVFPHLLRVLPPGGGVVRELALGVLLNAVYEDDHDEPGQ